MCRVQLAAFELNGPIESRCSISRITRAGFPTTTEFGGTLLVTTEPAPITAPFPIVTPFRIRTPYPIQTPELDCHCSDRDIRPVFAAGNVIDHVGAAGGKLLCVGIVIGDAAARRDQDIIADCDAVGASDQPLHVTARADCDFCVSTIEAANCSKYAALADFER